MSENVSETVRQPVSANGRMGYALASICWVLLTALVAFLHHHFTKSPQSEPGSVKIGQTLLDWIPHSALGFLLLTTVVIDVLIDLRDSTINRDAAWITLVIVLIGTIALMFVEIFTNSFVLSLWIGSLVACAMGKYFSLRDYKW